MRLRLKIALELERLRRNNLKRLHPLQQLFWESTLRCNVHCLHCGSDCNSANQLAINNQQVYKDMPAEDFLRVIDSISKHQTLHTRHQTLIIISGGEPLMRKDLADIGRALYEREYPWGMVTNGLALTEAKFRELRSAGLRSMSISLDGLEQDHIWLRQHPLAFEGATRAIRLAAAESDFTWDVVTCVNQRNIDHLDRIRDLLWSLGCRDWRVVTIDPMGRAATNPELLLRPAQLQQVLEFIKAERQQGRHVSYGCEGFLGGYEGQVRDHLYMCAAGITTASILIDGSISACTSIRGRYYQGNIYKDDFWTVWENGFQPYRDRSWMKKRTPCSDCKMFRYCEGNGMHLRREDGSLMLCHLHRLADSKRGVHEQ